MLHANGFDATRAPCRSATEEIENEFGEASHDLGNGHVAYHLTHQDAEFGPRESRKAAFIWIWYIDHHPPRQLRIVIDA